MLQVLLLFLVLIGFNFGDDFFSDISAETDQKTDLIKAIPKNSDGLENKAIKSKRPNKKKHQNYLLTQVFPDKKLSWHWVKQNPQELELLIRFIEDYLPLFSIKSSSIYSVLNDGLSKVNATDNEQFLVAKEIKELSKRVHLKAWKPILVDVTSIAKLMDKSFPFLLENHSKAYADVVRAKIPAFFKYSSTRKYSSLHVYISLHLYFSYLKSILPIMKSIARIQKFAIQEKNKFKILYLSTSLRYRPYTLLTHLDKMKIDRSAFFQTQGIDASLRLVLLNYLGPKLKNHDLVLNQLDELQNQLNRISISSKDDLVNSKKWIHPHLKSLVNDGSKVRMIRFLLAIIPQVGKDRIQKKLKRISQLEIFEDSLVLSKKVREASLYLTPRLIKSLRNQSKEFQKFEMYFPKAYHFACRLIVAEYFKHLNESLIRQIPQMKYDRFIRDFKQRKQKTLFITGRNLTFTKNSLELLNNNTPNFANFAFKKPWLSFERDMIWFHRLILSYRIDLNLHHFNLQISELKKLQTGLSKSIHLVDLFELLTLENKKKLSKEFTKLNYYTVRFIDTELYLLEQSQENKELRVKEESELYRYTNTFLITQIQQSLQKTDESKLKSINSYFSKSNYLNFVDRKLQTLPLKKPKGKKVLFTHLKHLSKNLRNLIYLLQI